MLDYNGGVLTIDGGTITSSGTGGNLVYSHGAGAVTISDAALTGTSKSDSNEHSIYTSGAGTIVANYVTATSLGPSSSIVAADRGGGTVTVNGRTNKNEHISWTAAQTIAPLFLARTLHTSRTAREPFGRPVVCPIRWRQGVCSLCGRSSCERVCSLSSAALASAACEISTHRMTRASIVDNH